MIKLIAFDWNGTLLSDVNTVVEGGNKELEVLGRPPLGLKVYRELYDVPIMEFYKKIGISAEEFTAKSEEIGNAFHSYYEPMVAKARTRPGARKALADIHAKKIKQLILSNHTIEGIYFQLNRLRLIKYFDTVLANETILNNHFSGKEQRLAEYMAENDLDPSEVVIVGDTVEEIRIAKKLGTKIVSLTGGYNSTKRLQAAKPDVIINTLSELVPALEELSK